MIDKREGYRDRNAILDLFGAEESALATVVQDEECADLRQISATHEFGHVFGGGHHLEIPNPLNGYSWLQADGTKGSESEKSPQIVK